MKYFRKHPDLLIIANYPEGMHRIRRARLTTAPQLSKILVHAITSTLAKTKKILLLTDSPDTKKHTGFITRTSWAAGKPFSIFQLTNRFIYNHETHTVCLLFHPDLFGRFWTDFFTLFLIGSLRITGKHTMMVFLTTPKLSVQPTLLQTIRYFIRFALYALYTTLATKTVVGEKLLAHKLMRLTGKKTILAIPMTFRSLNERRIAGKIFNEELFPSPIKNLGLTHYLHPDARTKPAA
ncbi:MAG: hypothetical protein NT149_03045 [Candidatus Gottesmanbacteria bacterium]|nr:hypothetical protein [Candidatus Gottesmanbacteria bacterium]